MGCGWRRIQPVEKFDEGLCLRAKQFSLPLQPANVDFYIAVSDGNGLDAVARVIRRAQPWAEPEHIGCAEQRKDGGTIADIHHFFYVQSAEYRRFPDKRSGWRNSRREVARWDIVKAAPS